MACKFRIKLSPFLRWVECYFWFAFHIHVGYPLVFVLLAFALFLFKQR